MNNCHCQLCLELWGYMFVGVWWNVVFLKTLSPCPCFNRYRSVNEKKINARPVKCCYDNIKMKRMTKSEFCFVSSYFVFVLYVYIVCLYCVYCMFILCVYTVCIVCLYCVYTVYCMFIFVFVLYVYICVYTVCLYWMFMLCVYTVCLYCVIRLSWWEPYWHLC